METRSINGTGLEVSRACLGTMTFGAQVDRRAACHILQFALDAGINFIDTANVYAGGESERVLGELLDGRRQDVVLASKVGMKVGDEQPGLSRNAIFGAVENSLKRLRTDYLDVCYLHLPDSKVPLQESLEAMECLVRQGKIRYPASSNFASWQLCKMLGVAQNNGYQPVRIAQPMYNLLSRRIEDEFLPACKDLGVSTIAYNPLAGGLLTGKHRKESPIPGSRFDKNPAYLDRYWNEQAFDVVTRLSTLAAASHRSLISLSLNWLLHHTPADCVILGASSIEQLQENLRALDDGPVPQDMLQQCDHACRPLMGAAPKYNR